MIQTIDETILFCEQVAKLKEYRIDEEKEIAYSRLEAPTNDMRPMTEIEKLNRDAERYRQIAEWLRELKAYRVHMRAYRMDLIARFEDAVKGDGYQNGIGMACDLFDSYLKEVNADEG